MMRRDDARWFRALLRLFPAEFRGDFGRQMVDDFRDQREETAARRGTRGKLGLWFRTVADVLRRAPLEHADVLRRDAAHAIRILRKRPASTATVIASIAIGIGLNTALFTVVRGVLWQSLPLADSDRLVRIVEVDPAFPERFPHLTPGDFVDLREQTRGFSGIAAGQSNIQTIVEPGEPEELPGMMVSERYFETLGARLALGRSFTDADYVEANIDFSGSAVAARLDERAKGQPLVRSVIVISHQLWHRRFLGRPDVVGQQLRLASGVMVEIVGVMGPEMRAIAPAVGVPPEWWMPRAPSGTGRGNTLETVARLAPGQSLDSARAELATVGASIAAAFPGVEARSHIPSHSAARDGGEGCPQPAHVPAGRVTVRPARHLRERGPSLPGERRRPPCRARNTRRSRRHTRHPGPPDADRERRARWNRGCCRIAVGPMGAATAPIDRAAGNPAAARDPGRLVDLCVRGRGGDRRRPVLRDRRIAAADDAQALAGARQRAQWKHAPGTPRPAGACGRRNRGGARAGRRLDAHGADHARPADTGPRLQPAGGDLGNAAAARETAARCRRARPRARSGGPGDRSGHAASGRRDGRRGWEPVGVGDGSGWCHAAGRSP